MKRTLLYLSMIAGSPSHERKLAGIRRYGSMRGWEAVPIPREEVSPESLPDLLRRHQPVGCVADGVACSHFLRPSLFRGIPVSFIAYPWDIAGRFPNFHFDSALIAPAARVVMIGVDGLGARWIPWNEMPNLSRLRDEGVFAVARCHRPTASAINWKSVFSGIPPELHGYNLWNSKEPGIEPPASAFGPDGAMPDLFSEIRRQKPDARTVSLYAWGGLGFCHATNAASVARHFGGSANEYSARDASVFDEGLRQLAEKPLFMLLYQGQVDESGHLTGWGSPEYLSACRNVDANIGRLVDGLHALHLQIPNDVYNGCRRTYVGEGSSEITIDGALAVRSLSGRTLCVFRPAAQGALTYNGLTSLRIEEVCTAVHEESLHLLPGDILCDENYEVEVLPVDGGWLAR